MSELNAWARLMLVKTVASGWMLIPFRPGGVSRENMYQLSIHLHETVLKLDFLRAAPQ